MTLFESVCYLNQSDTRKFKNKNNTIWLVHEKCCENWLANDRDGGAFCECASTRSLVLVCLHLFRVNGSVIFLFAFRLLFLLINLSLHVCLFAFFAFTCFVFVFVCFCFHLFVSLQHFVCVLHALFVFPICSFCLLSYLLVHHVCMFTCLLLVCYLVFCMFSFFLSSLPVFFVYFFVFVYFFQSSGKCNCCTYGGDWFGNCVYNLDHTWEAGLHTCESKFG